MCGGGGGDMLIMEGGWNSEIREDHFSSPRLGNFLGSLEACLTTNRLSASFETDIEISSRQQTLMRNSPEHH